VNKLVLKHDDIVKAQEKNDISHLWVIAPEEGTFVRSDVPVFVYECFENSPRWYFENEATFAREMMKILELEQPEFFMYEISNLEEAATLKAFAESRIRMQLQNLISVAALKADTPLLNQPRDGRVLASREAVFARMKREADAVRAELT